MDIYSQQPWRHWQTRGDASRRHGEAGHPKAGFESKIGIFSVREERLLHLHISIGYDRDVAGEDQRALESDKALQTRLLREDFLPHRLGLTILEYP